MTADIKEVDDQGMTAWDSHDPDAFADLMADNFTWIDSTTPEPMTTKDQVREYMGTWFTAFPDMKVKQINRVIDDHWLAAEIEFTATNDGTLAMGGREIPATGKKINGKGVYFARVQDGKIVEFRSYPDAAGMMMQLGLM